MGKVFTVLFLIFVVFSCKTKPKTDVDVPEGVLKPEAMVEVLTQIHIAEGKVIIARTTADSSKALFNYYKQGVLIKNKIDTGILNKSFRFYAKHPDVIDKIYANVVDTLGIKEQLSKY